MANHLLIIDALNLIRRIYAVQERQVSDPAQLLMQTQHAISNACRKLLQASAPTHVIAVFDGQSPSWRSEIYPDYKAGRKPMPPTLEQHLPAIQDTLWELGIDALLTEGDEADDLIATLAEKMSQHRQDVTIVSTDKGYCQLLNPWIRIRDYFNKRWLDLTFVNEHFHVKPTQLCDYWALTGISGSHIAGVPGIGPKTAASLLNQYTDLESLFASETIPEKQKQKLLNHQDEALLARRLVRLKRDIPLGFNLRDIRYQPHNHV